MKRSTQNSALLALATLVSGVVLIATAPAWGLALLVFMISMNMVPATRIIQTRAARGELAGLRPGLPIALTDLGTVYEARILDAKPPGGDEITEVGADHFVVRSATGAETRIPAASIKAVIWTRSERETQPVF